MNADNIPEYIYIGRDSVSWYEECAEVFIELFGEGELDLVCKLLAATSINTSLKANISLFRRAYYEIKQGLAVGSLGNYLPSIAQQLGQVRDGKDLTGRKINNFARAMRGDRDAVVVDVWLMRAFNIDTKRVLKSGRVANHSPSKRQYDYIEQWVRERALRMRLEPRQLAAIIWSGVRITQSGDRQTHYRELLRARLTNLFNVI